MLFACFADGRVEYPIICGRQWHLAIECHHNTRWRRRDRGLPLTTSTTTSAGVGFILSSLNQSAPAPKKQSQALNDYLMLHQDQFAMHVTLGAGASLNALMQVMKTPAAEHARWFKAIRRHRKPLLMVLRMPPGIERGEAFYRVLRQIQDTI